MSAYSDQIDASRDRGGQLFKQVQRAILKVAGYIVGTETSEVPNHRSRVEWARKIRYGPLSTSEDQAARMMPLMLENATISANPLNATDSDVQWVVETNLDQFIRGGN